MSQNVQYIISLRDKFSGRLKGIQASTERLKTSVMSLSGAMTGLFVGGAIIGGAKSLLDAYDKQEQAIAQVRQGLISTGNAAGRTLEQLEGQASSLQKKTLFGDEEILQGATAQLLTFTNITGEQFDKAQQAILDVTTRLNGAGAGADALKSTSIQLGKALNDPIANLSALSRSGIQFTDQQKQMIKTLWETGRRAEAQSLILEELEKQYGGSAAAAADAGMGGFKQLQNAIGDLKEKMGKELLPMIQGLTSIISKSMGFIERNAEVFKTLFQVIVNSLPILALLTAGFMAFNLVMNANPIMLIVTGVALLIGALITAWQKSEAFRGSILGLWEVLKQLWVNIKDTFMNFPKLILEAFKAIPMAIYNSFKDLGKILEAVFTGNFKALPDLIKNLSKNALQTNPLTGVYYQVGKNMSKGVVNGFKKGYAKGKIIKKETDKTIAGMGIQNGLDTTIGLSDSATTGATAETKITSQAPRVFNINIDKLVENFTVSTNTLKESTGEIKEAVLNALLGSLNDTQIVLNQ